MFGNCPMPGYIIQIRQYTYTIILPTAYVLVLCNYDYSEDDITSQLTKLPCVTGVDRVDGPYDIIVKLSDNNMDLIRESIGKHMTRIHGIQSTITLMAEE
jgi:DNA-binding Lrp family transcriptional regulator